MAMPPCPTTSLSLLSAITHACTRTNIHTAVLHGLSVKTVVSTCITYQFNVRLPSVVRPDYSREGGCGFKDFPNINILETEYTFVLVCRGRQC